MVPKTEDKAEWIGFTWGQKALLTISSAQRKGTHVAPTILCDFTSIGYKWLQIKRSVPVAHDIKSPLRGKQRKIG